MPELSTIQEPKNYNYIIPWSLSLLVIILGGFIAWKLWDNETMEIRNEIRFFTESQAENLELDLSEKLAALERLAKRWEIRGGTPYNELTSDVSLYMTDMPGIKSFQWIDNQYRLQWFISKAGDNRADINIDLDEKKKQILAQVYQTRSPYLSSINNFPQIGKGLSIIIPLFYEGKSQGFIEANLVFFDWFREITLKNSNAQEMENFRSEILFDNISIFRQLDWQYNQDTTFRSDTKIMGHIFTINSQASRHFLEIRNTKIPLLSLIASSFLAIMIGLLVYLYQKANTEAWRTHASRLALEAEIVHRQETEKELKEITERFSLATKAGKIGVWDWDIPSGRINWNDVMYEIVKIPYGSIQNQESWFSLICADSQALVAEELRQALSGDRVFNSEYCIQAPNSKRQILRAAARLEKDANNQARRMIGVSWDITERVEAQELLNLQRGRLESILEGSNVGTWEWNIKNNTLLYNERFAEMLGYNSFELGILNHQLLLEKIHPEDLEAYEKNLDKHLLGEKEYFEQEIRLQHRDGSWVWVLCRGRINSWSPEGDPLEMAGIHQNINRRKRAERALQESQETLRSTLESMDDLIFVLDMQDAVVDLNQPKNKENFFISTENILNKPFRDVLPQALARKIDKAIKNLKKSGALQQFEFSLKKASVTRWYQARISKRKNQANYAGLTLIIRDITRRKEYEEQIKRLANHDTLTSLPSLRLTHDRLDMALNQADRKHCLAAILFMDLDGFKVINDTYGHETGDYVLKEIALRLNSLVRKSDTVGRIGGDEFLIILNELPKRDLAGTLSQKIIQAVNEPIRKGSESYHVGTSIGISLYPSDARTVDSLIKEADKAMYFAKYHGKNRYTYYADIPKT